MRNHKERRRQSALVRRKEDLDMWQRLLDVAQRTEKDDSKPAIEGLKHKRRCAQTDVINLSHKLRLRSTT